MTPTTPSPSVPPLLRQEGSAAARKDLDRARAEETARLVKQHMPEAVSFIRDLYQAGMIEGWRNVHSFRLNTEGPQP